MSEWQPIETAPKDERQFLVVQEDGDIWIVSRGYAERLNPKESGCGCCSDQIYDATHWMPLPKPPGADQ